jgi:hypothetical protein
VTNPQCNEATTRRNGRVPTCVGRPERYARGQDEATKKGGRVCRPLPPQRSETWRRLCGSVLAVLAWAALGRTRSAPAPLWRGLYHVRSDPYHNEPSFLVSPALDLGALASNAALRHVVPRP